MNINFTWLIARMREPSTYAGLAALIAAVGIHMNAVDIDTISKAAMAAAGLAAMFMTENKG